MEKASLDITTESMKSCTTSHFTQQVQNTCQLSLYLMGNKNVFYSDATAFLPFVVTVNGMSHVDTQFSISVLSSGESSLKKDSTVL